MDEPRKDRTADGLIRDLAEHHGSIDSAALMRPYADVMVKVPGTGRPFRDPYIPFVGPSYRPGGLLVLATAQNLAQFGKSGDSPHWRQATGFPEAPLFRLYSVEGRTVSRPLEPWEVSYRNISIQPFEDGVLPALAGLWMAAAGVDPPEDLNEVTERIAVTNFYKHSLRTPSGRDLNPGANPFRKRLPSYRETTLRAWAIPEIEVLRPGAILAFSGVPRDPLETAAPGVRWFTINDPAWIKRGMGGVARVPDGSWYRKASSTPLPETVRDLLGRYIGQMRPPYMGGKTEATFVYLIVNYLRFREAHEAGGSSA